MAKNSIQEGTAAQQVVADETTMTTYGVTVAGLIADGRRACEEVEKNLLAEQKKTAELSESISSKDHLIASLEESNKIHLQTIALLKSQLGFKRLPDGGVSFLLVLDIDAASPLLDQAEGAQEDPATFIPRQVSEAMLAYANS